MNAEVKKNKNWLAGLLWGGILGIFVIIIVIPGSRKIFIQLTESYPYALGFVKFGILASMGEILAGRMTSNRWGLTRGFGWKLLIWGAIGMLITLVFKVFAGGVGVAMEAGYLPTADNKILNAFIFAIFVSVLMNTIFGPTFMAFHRVTDTFIDMKCQGKKGVKLIDVTSAIDWNGFISFVVIKTIPLFWIPAHTVTFMLPPEYRVVMAAFLSIMLGIILALAKDRK